MGETEWESHNIEKYASTFNVPKTYSNLKPISHGVGAFGMVCSAIKESDKSPVAIKKIARIFNPELAKRVYREILVLKHVNHHNLLALYEVFTDANSKKGLRDIYIVTELLDVNLRMVLSEDRPITDYQKLLYSYQLCSGLKYLHSCNIMHRDLKPDNICLYGDDSVKLIDFGLSRSQETETTLTSYVATRWYRAPELLISIKDYSTKIDMWSLGCIMAELFTKKVIFNGRDTKNQLKLIVEKLGFPEEQLVNTLFQNGLRTFSEIANEGAQISRLEENELCGIDQNALDLIRRLLVWNPNERLSAADALQHPYFEGCHDESDEPTGNALSDPYEDGAEFSLDYWKDIIFDQMDFHRE